MNDKERALRSLIGASLELSEVDLDLKYFEDVNVGHIEGYTLYNNNLTKKFIKLAKKSVEKIAFLGPAAVVLSYRMGVLLDLTIL
jgi:hypothetical protein